MADKAKSVSEFLEVFRCPYCKNSFRAVDLKSLKCPNNHTFDFAKQGYVNMMIRPSISHYNKALFEARQKMIMESHLYSLLHKEISNLIKEHLGESSSPSLILDAGCGEGSHLQKIIEEARNSSITGIGLDISKEGILMAAKKYKKLIWLVGDVANAPFVDQSFQINLNILSPLNYTEFKRLLAPNGLVMKVVPRSSYLKELREALFNDTEKKVYHNDDTVYLFKKHFQLKDVISLRYTKKLEQTELEHFVQMSPLSWTSNQADIEAFILKGFSEVTIDLDILIGLNKKNEEKSEVINNGKSMS
ncbi:putative RNA methyltransferase [Metabacillus sp. Hm71]|uniref:putative RNA methyltransferase n=1 Tax=Metabacillus sp. Hm71 TaxID=3450743 RepID=UPI003F420250